MTEELKKEKDVIEVSADKLNRILDEIEDLKRKNVELEKFAVTSSQPQNTGIVVNSRVKEKFIRVRKWDGEWVVGFENIGTEDKPKYTYLEYDKQTREELHYINIITMANGKLSKPKKILLVDYNRDSELVEVKILEKKEQEFVTNQGYIAKKGFAENGYGMYETTVQVPIEIIEKKYSYVVELDGTKAEIQDTFVG